MSNVSVKNIVNPTTADTTPTDNLSKQVCKAWVNFDGTGVPTIRDSYNVSSITDNGTGDYTVNFATPMSNANYSVGLAGRQDSDSNDHAYDVRPRFNGLYSTTGVQVSFGYYTTVNVYRDCKFGLVQVFSS